VLAAAAAVTFLSVCMPLEGERGEPIRCPTTWLARCACVGLSGDTGGRPLMQRALEGLCYSFCALLDEPWRAAAADDAKRI